MAAARSDRSPVILKIDQWGNVDVRPTTSQSVNLVFKARASHLTEAANRGIPLPEAMQQSLHKSPDQAASHHNTANAGCAGPHG